MIPVLFSIGKISVSSFAVLMTFGFLFGIFLIWRLARAWDLDEEKVLDLTFLTSLGGLIGARIYFTLEHIHLFISKIFSIMLPNKVPGFSFWGAFIGGWLALIFFARHRKQNFWLILDIASVGFLGGLIFYNLGCFLSGCNVGIQSNLFFAVKMVGVTGKRLPVQILEAILLSVALFRIWSVAIRFHRRGRILSLFLICVGVIKLILEPLKANHDEGIILSLVLCALGALIYYKLPKATRT